MMILDFLTSIILAFLGAAGGALFMRSKYKAEVDEARANAEKADNEAKEKKLENVDRLVKMYKEVYETLAEELKKEREALKETILKLQNDNKSLLNAMSRMERAIKSIKNCPHSHDCPALIELQNSTDGEPASGDGKNTSNRQRAPDRKDRSKAGQDSCRNGEFKVDPSAAGKATGGSKI